MFQQKKVGETSLLLKTTIMFMHNESIDSKISNLYEAIDLQSFISVISVFEDETVKFPSVKQVRENLIASLLYYYRELKGMDWQEIKKVVPFEFSSIKYSVKIRNMKASVLTEIEKHLKKLEA